MIGDRYSRIQEPTAPLHTYIIKFHNTDRSRNESYFCVTDEKDFTKPMNDIKLIVEFVKQVKAPSFLMLWIFLMHHLSTIDKLIMKFVLFLVKKNP